MSEAEIIGHTFSVFDRYWAIEQWWASISFALILVGYFAADRLNAVLVVTLISIYTMYSLWIGFLLTDNLSLAVALTQDLESLIESDGTPSNAAKAVLDQAELRLYGTLLGVLAQICTFFACAGYLVVAYRKSRDRGN